MRQSQLFTKTKKEAPADEVSKNAQLLIRAGYIHKEMAGAYAYLPLGLRVLERIIGIIREEMRSLGGQEVFLTALQNPQVWEKTGRWNTIDVWFTTKLKSGGEMGLATTHEEPLTALMTEHIQSYKDLPAYVYQFQTKFRNELRAKSGLMRVREFIMKDLYSFTRTEAELDEFYEQCAAAYLRIFARVGLGEQTYRTFASGGAFSKFSDEFQAVSDAGEDTIYVDEKKRIAVNKEVYTDAVLQELGLRKESLVEKKAIEIGNIFKLGTKYSEALGLTFTDEEGNQKPVIMGSYGIGPGRLMGAIAEICHDKRGIVWPSSVAPFQVHLLVLTSQTTAVRERADALYDKLQSVGVSVLYDDRTHISSGEKFADADLIGIPYRVVVSDRTGEQYEVKKRTEQKETLVSEEALLTLIRS